MIGPLETFAAIAPSTERCAQCIKPAVYFRREHDQIEYACQEHATPLVSLKAPWRPVDGVELGANKIFAGLNRALDVGAKVRARRKKK